MKDRMIPKEWTRTRIGSACSVSIGGTPSRGKLELWDREKETDNVWVSIRDLKKKYIGDTAQYISNSGVRKSNVKKVSKGTTLMSFKLTIGRVGVAQRDLYTNEAIAALVPNGLLSNEYLYYGLQFWNLLGDVDTAVKGSTLNKEKIKKIPIFFPASLPEQNQIVAVLCGLDELISKTEALIAKLGRVKQGLMQDLLTFGIDETGNIRSEKTHRFKDSPLGRIPVEWEVRPLRQYLQYISYGFTNPMPETEGGPYMVTATNIFDGRVQYESCRHTSEYAYRNLLTKKSKPVLNDILLTKDGSLGRLALVDRSEICINQSVAVLRTEKVVSPQFIKRLLEAPAYQKRMDDDAGGSTIRHIYITRVGKMPIAVPGSNEEQAKICSMLSQADGLVEDEIAYRDKLCSLKRGLMEDLLTGTVRVNRLLKQ